VVSSQLISFMILLPFPVVLLLLLLLLLLVVVVPVSSGSRVVVVLSQDILVKEKKWIFEKWGCSGL